MLKKNKVTLIITSVILLLPMVVGLLLWNQLPEQVPFHWNAAGEVDGWSSRAVAVFVMPLIMLVIQWFCVIVTSLDPKHKNVAGKPMTLVLWICPVMNILISTMMYAAALGYDLSIEIIMPLAMGAMFIVIGNYMPKCKRNYTIGVKVPWALEDEANWNATHRFAGWVWVAGGVVIMLTSLLGNAWVSMGAILPMAIAPIVYSYVYYRNHGKGEAHEDDQ